MLYLAEVGVTRNLGGGQPLPTAWLEGARGAELWDGSPSGSLATVPPPPPMARIRSWTFYSVHVTEAQGPSPCPEKLMGDIPACPMRTGVQRGQQTLPERATQRVKARQEDQDRPSCLGPCTPTNAMEPSWLPHGPARARPLESSSRPRTPPTLTFSMSSPPTLTETPAPDAPTWPTQPTYGNLGEPPWGPGWGTRAGRGGWLS